MHYTAHLDLTRPSLDTALTIFEAETEDAAFEYLATSLGGHPAIADGFANNRGNGYSGVWSRSRENRQFWGQVLHDIFDTREMADHDWLSGSDRAKVEAEAKARYDGEEAED